MIRVLSEEGRAETRLEGHGQVIKRGATRVRYCYQRQLSAAPDLTGRISVRFVIAADGSVSSATTKSSTMNNAAVEGCIKEVFLGFRFPEPAGGGTVIVSHPFVFTPA